MAELSSSLHRIDLLVKNLVFPEASRILLSDVAVKGTLGIVRRAHINTDDDIVEIPRTVIVKNSPVRIQPRAGYLNDVEVRMFRLMSRSEEAETSQHLIPRLFFSEIDPLSHQFVIVMQDLLDTETFPCAELKSYVNRKETYAIIRHLADFHSRFWDNIPSFSDDGDDDVVQGPGSSPLLSSFPDPMVFFTYFILRCVESVDEGRYSKKTHRLFLSRWTTLYNRSDFLTSEERAFLDSIQIRKKVDESLSLLFGDGDDTDVPAVRVLSHGDFRLDNLILFQKEGGDEGEEVGVRSFDFQMSCEATPGHDIAAFFFFNPIEEDVTLQEVVKVYVDRLRDRHDIEVRSDDVMKWCEATAYLMSLLSWNYYSTETMERFRVSLPRFCEFVEKSVKRLIRQLRNLHQ